jgi:F-type H+-transporting ATPase subunit b
MYWLLLLQEAAQHAEESSKTDLLTPNGGLMVWTLVIFLLLWFVLSKFAFKPITKAVEDREAALQEAIEAARNDRDAAQRLLAEQRAQIEAARDEAQRIIADGRATGDQLRAKMLADTRGEQQTMLERARREIGVERDRAIAELRREAVELAIAGASKVIEKNLDDQTNRKIVEGFLASIPPSAKAVS